MSVMTNTNCVLLLGFPFSPMHLEVFQYMMLPARQVLTRVIVAGLRR